MITTKISILLIEDNDADFELTAADLRRGESACFCEFSVSRSGSLKEGIEFLSNNSVDIVLLDIGLPDCVGVSGIVDIRKLDQSIPIIVLTGADDQDQALLALQAGAQDYLVKDKKYSTLSRAVRNSIQRQEILKNIEKAEKMALVASEAKSNFLANMSHEIRTPLTAILGFTDVMLNSDLRPTDRHSLTIVQRNATHLLQVINNILDISKIEAEETEIQRSPINLFQHMEQLELTFKFAAEGKNIQFGIDYKFPMPDIFEMDGFRVNQILINLVGNAIKFTKIGGVKVVIEYSEDTEMLTFHIIDTGIGLSADECAKLFQPFSQCDASNTRAYGGTGLGLVISKKLAEKLGGTINVSASKGIGSTFSVTVKAGKTKDSKILHEMPSKTVKERIQIGPITPNLHGRVLVADDLPDNRELLSYYIKQCGVDVMLVENGKQVIEKLTREQVDLIFLDMQMPVLDGYDCAKILRSQDCKVPIIAITANAMNDAADKCLKAGCSDYISKPFTADAFYRVINKYLCDLKKAEAVNTSDAPIIYSSILDSAPNLVGVVRNFVTRLPTRIAELERSYQQKNWAELRLSAHNLAGSEMFGFSQLRAASVSIGAAARAQKLEELEKPIKELKILCQRIQGSLPDLDRRLNSKLGMAA